MKILDRIYSFQRFPEVYLSKILERWLVLAGVTNYHVITFVPVRNTPGQVVSLRKFWNFISLFTRGDM